MEQRTIYDPLESRDYRLQATLQSFRGLDGQLKYSGIKAVTDSYSAWSWNLPADSLPDIEHLDKTPWDICICNNETPMQNADESETNQTEPRYAAVWNATADYEGEMVYGLSPEEQLEKCQQLASKGYRVQSISASSIGSQILAASVWIRPLISEQSKEILAKRQANAAVAYYRMNEFEKIRPLLKTSPDARVRTWIITQLADMGANPKLLLRELLISNDDSIRRALLIALRYFNPSSIPNRDQLREQLFAWYVDDPAPGIHGAVESVLRRWGDDQAAADRLSPLSTSNIVDSRQWYVTKTNSHTLAVIPEPSTVLIGGTPQEDGFRSSEKRHQRIIPRSYAIATKEVTVSQFTRFRKTAGKAFAYTEKYAPTLDCPQVSVNWYLAAAYCRWLSEEEGFPENQMCYPPIEEIEEGMSLLSLTRPEKNRLSSPHGSRVGVCVSGRFDNRLVLRTK